MTDNNPGPEYLKIEDAARLLRVTRRTIYRRIWSGDLPATKFGGLYFIRREDLQALLAQGRPAPLEIAEPAAQPLKCGYCFRLLTSDAQIGEACAQIGCDQIVCSQCMAEGIRHCAQHSPTREQRWAEAQTHYAAGEIQLLVQAPMARLREINFLNRIQTRITSIKTLIHPLSGEILNISSWEAGMRHADERAEVMRLLGKVMLDTNSLAQTPLNASLQFQIPAQKSLRGVPLAILVRVLNRLSNFLRDGFDTAALSAEDLTPWLVRLSEEAQRAQVFQLVTLASTTGWDASAQKAIQGDGAQPPFAHRSVLFYLFDLETGELIYNPRDDRARSYAELFAPVLHSEELEEVTKTVEGQMYINDSLSLAIAAQTMPYPKNLLKEAFERLAATGRYALTDVPRWGLTLVKHETYQNF